jgi:hypothetical protein
MNAALRAVAKLGAAQGLQVFGSLEGYDGLIDGHFRELTKVLPDGAITVDIEVDAAGGQGGTLIGSARSARFREKDGRVKAADELKKLGADGLSRVDRQRHRLHLDVARRRHRAQHHRRGVRPHQRHRARTPAGLRGRGDGARLRVPRDGQRDRDGGRRSADSRERQE